MAPWPAIAFTVGPAVAVLLAWLVLREPLGGVKIIGVVMVLVGVALIAQTGGSVAPAR